MRSWPSVRRCGPGLDPAWAGLDVARSAACIGKARNVAPVGPWGTLGRDKDRASARNSGTKAGLPLDRNARSGLWLLVP